MRSMNTGPWEAEDHAEPRNPTVERLSTALNRCQDINADLLAALEGLYYDWKLKPLAAGTGEEAGIKLQFKVDAAIAKAKAGKG